MGIRQRLRRIGDLFERHQASAFERAVAGNKRGIYASTGASGSKCGFASPRRSRACTFARCRKRCCPKRRSSRPGSVRQAGRIKFGPVGRCGQGKSAQNRRIRRSVAGHQRPGRKPRMRLAWSPGGGFDVARRSRHRVSPSRSLRPVWLPGRPRPGDLSLPGTLLQCDRPQGSG